MRPKPAILIHLRHVGNRWLCWSPSHSREVFHGRSIGEAVGKLFLYLAPELGVSVDAWWDDQSRTIPQPVVLTPEVALNLLRQAPPGQIRSTGRLIKLLEDSAA